MESTTIAQKRL
jgi:alkylation response protein AidB-like acyl-CoA dehydrogenase